MRELEGLVRAVALDLGLTDPGDLQRGGLTAGQLIVPVAVRLDPKDPAQAGSAHLLESVRARLALAMEDAGAFRAGHVYCFQCGRAACEHAAPSAPDEVFAGYTPTGKPRWRGFANLCLELGEERVDRLYAEPPDALALVMDGARLGDGLLEGFGRDSASYRVVAQIIAGLFPGDFDMERPAAPGRSALTIQIVERRGGLRLNVIGVGRDELAEIAARRAGAAEALRGVLLATEQRVGAASGQLTAARGRGAEVDTAALVGPLVARLRGDVARALRPPRHRTRHARERHADGERPIASALRDAHRAADHELLRDARRKTVIVLGPRGRAHVFTDDGRHVTSLQLRGGEVEKKVERGRWRPLPGSVSEAFRSNLPEP